VIAVRDGERFVGDAIDSALGQTEPPEEIVVVDDGSTDGTWAVVLGYGDALTGVRTAPRNVAAALNDGVARSTGDVVAFLDADDVWRPDKLARQKQALAADATLDAVFVHVQQFVDPGMDADDAARFAVPAGPQPGVSKTGMLIRRPALERVGPFSEVTETDFVEWWTRAVDVGIRWFVLDDVLADRRVHGHNSGITRRRQQVDADLDALKAMLDRRRTDRLPRR
jgi:glycosyltransferase involved in cell wall biosynthesis